LSQNLQSKKQSRSIKNVTIWMSCDWFWSLLVKKKHLTGLAQITSYFLHMTRSDHPGESSSSKGCQGSIKKEKQKLEYQE
jgi:hypothetical protein